MERTLLADRTNRWGGGRRLAARLAPLLVLALWAADAKAQSTALVSNLGQGGADTLDVSTMVIAQKFTTGANIGGYTLTSFEIRLFALTSQGDDSAAPRVRVVRGAAAGSDSVAVATLAAETATIPAGVATYTFTAPANTPLRPSTDYWIVVEAAPGGGDAYIAATASDSEDTASAAGWSIDDGSLERPLDSTGAFTANSLAALFRINGSARANSPAIGTPEIAGIATVGRRLHARPGDIADPDGVPHPFAYQWIRVDAGTETEIAGATFSSYLLGAADLGKRVRVRLSFTDDFGTEETLTSDPFPPTGSVAAAPLPGTPGAALVSNLGQSEAEGRPVGSNDFAQKFTTGTNPAGYALARVDIRLSAGSGTGTAAPRVRVVGGAATGSDSVEVASLTAETGSIAPGMAGGYAFLAPPNTALDPSTEYWVVVEAAPGGGDVLVGTTESDVEDAIPAAGWSIDDVALDRADESTGPFSDDQDALMIGVSGSRINSPATGKPEIAGTAAVGRRLQASPGSVADPDGVSSSLAYRWIRVDGTAETEIPGATASSYLLDAADLGKRVKVRLSFTDGGGTEETRLSDAYPPSGTVAPASLPGTPGAALVSNLGQGAVTNLDVRSRDYAQKFTTGSNARGYTLTGVELRLAAVTGFGSDTAAPRVRVVGGAAAGSDSVPVATLTAGTPRIPLDLEAGYAFTAPAGTVLRPSTDYWVVVEAASSGGDHVLVGVTGSHAEDGTPAAGWSIDDGRLERSSDSTADFFPGDSALMIRVSGTARPRAIAAPTAADGSVRTRSDTAYTFEAGDFGFAGAPGRGLASVKIETLPEPGKGVLTLDGDAVAAGQSIARSEIDAGNLEYV
ncbi:MAG: hypothetical protein OXP07_21625, partial [Defluviicoccus sp.]|nr:hypothetical protein [Defluviicoccus sp.]